MCVSLSVSLQTSHISNAHTAPCDSWILDCSAALGFLSYFFPSTAAVTSASGSAGRQGLHQLQTLPYHVGKGDPRNPIKILGQDFESLWFLLIPQHLGSSLMHSRYSPQVELFKSRCLEGICSVKCSLAIRTRERNWGGSRTGLKKNSDCVQENQMPAGSAAGSFPTWPFSK